jgi:hypothetical protein
MDHIYSDTKAGDPSVDTHLKSDIGATCKNRGSSLQRRLCVAQAVYESKKKIRFSKARG